MKVTQALVLAATTAFAVSNAGAATVNCPDNVDYDREAIVYDVAVGPCAFGTGNAKESDIQSAFGPSLTWSNQGEVEDADGTNGFLSVALTAGSWGSGDVDGTFTIADAFWSLYNTAVFSLHVGNSHYDPNDPTANEPDWVAFKLISGTTFGEWEMNLLRGEGGGLSNVKLWGANDATAVVPEPSLLMLMSLGIIGLVVARRRQAR